MYPDSLDLTTQEKDQLVEALMGAELENAGEFILEVPNLVFAIHMLETPKNQENLVNLAE